jgi:hypothetical protein
MIGFQVNPPSGQTVVLSVIGASSQAAVQMYYDQAATVATPATVSITAPETFYLATAGVYEVSMKIGGVEYGTGSNTPQVVNLSAGSMPILTTAYSSASITPITKGGTGATTAAGALANLGGVNSATVTRATTGPPSVLSTDQSGDFAIDTTAHVIYGPFASGAWPAGYYYGGGDNNAADYGYAGLVMRPEVAQGYVGAAGVVYLSRFTAVSIGPVNHIDYFVLVAGNTLTSNECFLAIYDTGQATSGSITRLALSSDQSGISGTGITTAALTASLSLTVGNDYYVAVLFNGNAAPTFGGTGNAQPTIFNNPAAANRLAWQNGSIAGPNTSLAASYTDVQYGATALMVLTGVRA